MSFDPDAYLKQPVAGGFDPDAWLKTRPGDEGFFSGTLGSARRGAKQALSTVDALTVVNSSDWAKQETAKADQLEQQADEIDRLQPQWSPENRQAWAKNAKLTAAALRQRVQQQAEANVGRMADIAQRGEESAAIPQTEGKRKFDEAQGLGDSLKALARNPMDVVSGVAAESLPASVPSLGLAALGSALGPGGTAAGAGAGSLAMEYGGTMLQTLQAEGYDLRKPETLAPLLNDPAALAALREKAAKRGIPVALFDALSAGIAGRLLRTPAKTALGKIGQGAAEMGVQGALGGAGEAAGGLVSGEGLDGKAILSEIIGEAGTGIGEIATGAVRDRALDTGKNVPEDVKTLRAQQEQLLEGRKRAQMFPVGTDELPLPEGMGRVETERGVFHFNPKLTTAEEIVAASKAGRENDVLGLGKFSKADIEDRVAQGEQRVAVTERTPEGTEVKAAVASTGTAQQTAAEFARSQTPGNTVAIEPVQRVIEQRPAPRGNLVGELLADSAKQSAAQREMQARELIAREKRQAELAEKRGRFDSRMTVARDVMAKPDATFAEVQGALESVKFYAEDNSLGLAQEQRETAKRTQALLTQRLESLQQAEQARRDQEQAARAAQAAAEEARRKAERAAAKQAAAADAAAGIGASGQFDYKTAPMAALERRAEQGDDKAIEWIERRSALESDTREDLLRVLERVKLPTSDDALSQEMKTLLSEEMTGAQVARFTSKRIRGLDQTAEALREKGFTRVQTPADVIDFVSRALRGERIYPEMPGGDDIRFATPTPKPATTEAAPLPAGLSESDVEREMAAIRKAFPELVRDNDVELGSVEAALRERGYDGEVPDTVRGAYARLRGERALIVLSARAYRDRAAGSSTLTHEMAHAYWDTLPPQTQEDLRELHQREVSEKTGPLYRDGQLQTELAYIEDMDERGHTEWFSERIARLNEQWAKGQLDQAEQPLLVRLAVKFRAWVRRVWSAMARKDGGDPDRALFVEEFRRFFLGGGDFEIGAKAGAAWARAMTPDFATEKGGGEVSEKRYDQLREQFDQLSTEAEELKREIAGIEANDLPNGEVEVKIRRDQLAENERTTKAIYAQLNALRKKLDEANPSKATVPEGKTPEQIIAEAARVESLPKVDRKGALIAAWRYGKEMRDKALKVGNETAADEGQRQVSRAKARLDDEYPGWEKEAYAKPGERPAPPPPPPADPVAADESDKEASPFGEPAREIPVRAGKVNEVYGHGSYEPTFLARTWQKVRDMLVNFKGAVPELPTFPWAKSNQSDDFVRREGPSFYNRVREGVRELNGSNDPVQRTAEEQVSKITRGLLEAGGDFSANDYAKLRKLQEQARRDAAEGKPVNAARSATIDALQSKLESHPYVLFNKVVLQLDLKWRHDNLKDSQGNPLALPMGVNIAEVDAELQRLGEKIAASDHEAAIRDAITQHMALVKQVAADLKARELMAADALQNPYYFPHVVLETTRGGKTEQRELRPERVRVDTEADFRGYLMDPVGSRKAIETDYVRAMYFHLVQVGAHNAKADVVAKFFRPYDVKAAVEKRAKELSKERGQTVSWEQAFHEEFAPQGYVLYGTNSGDAFPSITVDRDKLARRLGVMLTSEDLQKQLAELGLRGIKLLPEDLQETLQMGAKETWVLPARVAEALRGTVERQSARDNSIERALRGAMGLWKGWKLFMPWNHIRYEYGNVVADLEKLLSASPRTFAEMPAAAKELRDFWKGGEPSADLRAAIKEGVINTITAQEMGKISGLPAFREFETRAQKLWADLKAGGSAPLANLSRLIVKDGILGRVTSVEESAFREAVFRYAKFRHDLKALRNKARPDYAGAYWKTIEAMQESSPGTGDLEVRKAAAISRATFGDYGDLSVSGQYIRDKLAPFWSWTEINFRYHANLFRNLRDMVRAGHIARADAAKGGARALATAAAGFSARAAGAMLLRLALPYVVVVAWNNSDDREELEKLLSEEDRRRFHLIIGEVKDDEEVPPGFEVKRTRDGRRILVMYANTALMDVARWISGPKFVQVMGQAAQRKTTFATAFSQWRDDLVPDFLNNLAGSGSPLFKIPYTLASGKNPFPDVTDQQTIPHYDMRRHILGQMTDEFVADQIERIVNKDYYATKDAGAWARQLILQQRSRDPESWAFYAIKDKAAEFEYKMTGERSTPGSREAKGDQLVRNFRRAIFRGDVENATKFYLGLLEYGYTAERFAASIRAQDPLGDLAKKNGLREAFVRSLNPDEREQLQLAYVYYGKLNAGRGREAALFPKERWGARGIQRYQQQPRTDTLARLIDAEQDRSPGDELTRAERALKQSLKKSR